MAVSDGQPVDAATTNAAFMSRTQDTDTVGTVTVNNPTSSTDKDTGALVVEGGVGVEENLNVGGDADVTGTLSSFDSDVTNTLTVTGNAVIDDIQSDTIEMGVTASPSNKVFNYGPTRAIRSNETSGVLEFTNNGTVWTEIGTGTGEGGGGFKNYVANGEFEENIDGVTAYDDAGPYLDGDGGPATVVSVSRTDVVGEVLAGVGTLKITKAAANGSGEGVTITTEAVDPIDRGKALYWRMSYDTSDANYTANDLQLHCYDITNSVILPVQQVRSGGTTLPNTENGFFEVEVITLPTTEQIRLSMHIEVDSTIASAWDVYIDEVKLEVETPIHSPVVTDSKQYTPTLNSNTSVSFNEAHYRQIGDNLEMWGTIDYSGAGDASPLTISLPSGYTVDTAKISGESSTFAPVFGAAHWYDNPTWKLGVTIYNDATSFNMSIDGGGSIFFSNQTGAGDIVTWRAMIPVLEAEGGGIALARNAIYRMSSVLANGTNVTSTPSVLGEYRTYIKNASALTGTDNAPTGSFLPSRTDGMRIDGSTNFAGSGASGQPGRWEIFIGRRKNFRVEMYNSGGFTDAASCDVFRSGSTVVGIHKHYDQTTGVLTLDAIEQDGGTTTRFAGTAVSSGGGSASAVGQLYFDVIVSDNSVAFGTGIKRSELSFNTHAGYGSTNTKVEYFTNEDTTKQGTAFSYVNDSTNGLIVTLLEEGIYSVSYTTGGPNSTQVGGAIMLNGSARSNNPNIGNGAITFEDGVGSGIGTVVSTSVTLVGSIGDEINPQSFAFGSSGVSIFRIVKISD